MKKQTQENNLPGQNRYTGEKNYVEAAVLSGWQMIDCEKYSEIYRNP